MSKQLTLGLHIPQENTFENFISSHNHVAVEQLKNSHDIQFTYIYAGPGLGVSHLLHACCNGAPNNDAIYLDLKQLPKNPAIFEGLCDLSLCCIDHLEAVDSSATEEALFHLFNRMAAKNNRLIIANKIPCTQANIQLADLKSRLASGNSIEITEPDEQAKREILKQIAQRCGLELSDECITYMLTRHARDMSSLIEILRTLDKAAWIEQRRLSIPFIKQCLTTAPAAI